MASKKQERGKPSKGDRGGGHVRRKTSLEESSASWSGKAGRKRGRGGRGLRGQHKEQRRQLGQGQVGVGFVTNS